MTDTQIFTLAIAVVVPVSLLLLSNSRLTDLRVSLQRSIDEAKETLRAEAKPITSRWWGY
jgi:Sec-independent protein translocase protein TatA